MFYYQVAFGVNVLWLASSVLWVMLDQSFWRGWVAILHAILSVVALSIHRGTSVVPSTTWNPLSVESKHDINAHGASDFLFFLLSLLMAFFHRLTRKIE